MTESKDKNKSMSFIFKIVLIGDGRVGKTSLRRIHMGEGFVNEYLDTVGADFSYYKEVDEGANQVFKYSIWDLAGQPHFKSIRPMFYKGAFGALLCFDLTRKETLDNLQSWIDELILNTNGVGVPIIIVANKFDLYDENNSEHIKFSIINEKVKDLQTKYEGKFEIDFVKTSAKDGFNIGKAFFELRKSIFKKHTFKN